MTAGIPAAARVATPTGAHVVPPGTPLAPGLAGPGSGATAVGGRPGRVPADAGMVPRRGFPAYVWLFLAFLAANMFSGYSGYIGFPVGPDRLLFAAWVVLLLLDRRTFQLRRIRLGFVHAAMLALVLVAVFSALKHGSLFSGLGLYALLDRIVIPFGLFVLAPLVLTTPGRRDLFLKLAVLIGLYLGLTAVFEMAGPQSLVFPRYIADPSVGIHFGRARGPFVESVANGVVMVQVGFAAGLAAVRFRSWWRYAAVAAAALSGLGVILTLTRSVWIGGAAGVLLVTILVPRLRRYLPAVVLLGVVAVAALFAFIPSLSTAASDRAADERPVWDRQNTDLAALRIMEQRPLQGIGWEQFLEHGADFVRQARDYPITAVHLEVHNVFLARGAELGIPGLLLFVAAVALGPGRAVFTRTVDAEHEGWRAMMIGAAVAWFAGAMLSPLGTPLPNFLVWIIAGVVLAPRMVQRTRAVVVPGEQLSGLVSGSRLGEPAG